MKDQETILLVEDNEDDAFLMRRALRAAGISNPLQIVADGQKAIDYLSGAGPYSDRDATPVPALIFLDLKLPFVRGLDVLAWVRSHHLKTPVVVILTSSEEPRDVEEAYRLGANSYLVKPATAPQLMEMAKACKIYWIEYNRTKPVAPTP